MSQLTFEGNIAREELTERGFTLMEHGISVDAIDSLIAAYADFTDNLPDPDLKTMSAMITDPEKLDEIDFSRDRQKGWHKYRTNHPFIFKPGGYTNRSLQARALREFQGIEIEDDPKEYYHFLPSSTALMNQQRETYEWGALPPEVERLNTHFARIHSLGSKAIRGLMGRVEETYPELSDKIITPEDLLQSPLRLLFYHPGQGDVLAGGHYDKSVFTAQLAESHEGLRIRDPESGEMQEIRRSPDQAVMFAGSLLTLDHVYPDSAIRPGWHDVINIDVANEARSLHGNNVARWALIFFANSSYAGEIGKDITHFQESDELVA